MDGTQTRVTTTEGAEDSLRPFLLFCGHILYFPFDLPAANQLTFSPSSMYNIRLCDQPTVEGPRWSIFRLSLQISAAAAFVMGGGLSEQLLSLFSWRSKNSFIRLHARSWGLVITHRWARCYLRCLIIGSDVLRERRTEAACFVPVAIIRRVV